MGCTGTIVEVGAGHGLNFPHYPPTVDEVVAIGPEATLRAAAEKAAASASVPIRAVAGVAEELRADDASPDAVVASLVLCSVPDQARAFAEAQRVLRPGGELRFYEHVIPNCQPKRALITGRSRRRSRLAGRRAADHARPAGSGARASARSVPTTRRAAARSSASDAQR